MPERAATLVMAPNWLGDAVMALPALADLKRHAPGNRLIVAARPSVSTLFELAGSVDATVTLEWKGRLLSRTGLRRDIEALRNTGAGHAVLLPNSFASAWLVKAAGVAERSGYATDFRTVLLTRPIERPRGSIHQSVYYQRLMSALDVPTGPLEARLEVPAEDVATARALLTAAGWRGVGRLVALAPGAAYGTAKRWLPRHFATLVTAIAGEQHTACVLVGGAADAHTTALVRGMVPVPLRDRVYDLAGATTLRNLAGVLRLASVCVSNDSGAMHLAGAVGAPLVSIFGPTNERETAPLTWHDRPSRVLTAGVWCRPCMLRECPIDHRCMTRLAPRTVLDAVQAAMVPASGAVAR
jgi:heptosyltransferase-2